MNLLLEHYKEILGAITIIIIVPQVYLYWRSILIWETKPHIYTKIIWFILTGIGFLIQLQHGWGPWARLLWGVSLTQLTSLLLAIKYGTPDITRLDTILLIGALTSIPLYLTITDKLYALLFVIFIDMLGYIPTMRKSYGDPYSENITVWMMSTIKYILSIFALVEFSLYTLAYPVFLIGFNSILLAILILKRK